MKNARASEGGEWGRLVDEGMISLVSVVMYVSLCITKGCGKVRWDWIILNHELWEEAIVISVGVFGGENVSIGATRGSYAGV